MRDNSNDAIKVFSWDSVATDLQNYAPTLYNVLRGCVDVKRLSYSTRRAPKRPSSSAVISVCVEQSSCETDVRG